MIRANVEPAAITPPLALLNAALRMAGPDHPRRGPSEGGVADRFCAWAGRSGRRYIFSVFGLGPDASQATIPLVPKAIALMVRRPDTGPRRVVWAELMETEDGVATLLWTLARQAGLEASEIHLHAISPEAEARRSIFADLAFPRLDPAEPLSGVFRLAG